MKESYCIMHGCDHSIKLYSAHKYEGKLLYNAWVRPFNKTVQCTYIYNEFELNDHN